MCLFTKVTEWFIELALHIFSAEKMPCSQLALLIHGTLWTYSLVPQPTCWRKFSKSDGDPVSRWKSFSFWYWKWGVGLVDSPICSNFSLKLKLRLWKISTLVSSSLKKRTSWFSSWWVVIDAIAPKEYLRPNASQAIRHSPRRWVYLWGWFRRFSLSVSHDLAATLQSFSYNKMCIII